MVGALTLIEIAVGIFGLNLAVLGVLERYGKPLLGSALFAIAALDALLAVAVIGIANTTITFALGLACVFVIDALLVSTTSRASLLTSTIRVLLWWGIFAAALALVVGVMLIATPLTIGDLAAL